MQEKQPFDIVLKLAINGEIDPWNVDIVDLADKYLREIKNMYIPNLRYASKIIMAAALLLKMKAEALDITKEEEKEEKIHRKRLFGIKRFYTIEEIANVLKEYISPVIEFKPSKNKNIQKSSPKIISRNKNKFELPPLFHAVLEDAIKLIEAEIQNIVNVITLKDLTYPNKSQAFVALLFLNYDNKINIYQYQHFGDIFIEKNIDYIEKTGS